MPTDVVTRFLGLLPGGPFAIKPRKLRNVPGMMPQRPSAPAKSRT
jgi:hypothetical protein